MVWHINCIVNRYDPLPRQDAGHLRDLWVADCRTMEGGFQAPINNISSGGVFIDTRQRLFAGQEIALKFDFPEAGSTIMANGEIVRTSFEGAGIRFKMFFKK